MGFVFNFITYGGHQIDGVAAEEFATNSSDRTACWRLLACSAEMRLVDLTAHRKPWSAGRAATPHWPRRLAARRPPNPWARVPPSTSISCRPRCRRSRRRTGRRCGASTTSFRKNLPVQLRPRRAGSGRARTRHLRRRRDPLAYVVVDPIKDRHWSQHPAGARPEHLRREATPKALDDVDPPLARCTASRPTPFTTSRPPRTTSIDREDEVARHLQRGKSGRRRDHRRRGEPPAYHRLLKPGSG